MAEFTEEFMEKMEQFYENDPFIHVIDMSLVNIEDGQVTLGMPITEKHTNAHGIAHGGVLMSLADTAMGASCMSVNKKVVTMDLNINFIRAAKLGENVIAVAEVLHNGGKTMVSEAKILSEKGDLCAKARGTFFVIDNFVN